MTNGQRQIMSPLERAARALAEAESGEDCFDNFDEDFQEAFREAARAVLKAVREPGPAIVDVGAAWLKNMHSDARTQALDAWRSMIDATIEGS